MEVVQVDVDVAVERQLVPFATDGDATTESTLRDSADVVALLQEQLVHAKTDGTTAESTLPDSADVAVLHQEQLVHATTVGNAAENILPSLADVDVSGSLKGVKAKTWQELAELYRRHANCLGFGTRKSTQRRGKDMVIEKYFLCSCEGFAREGPGTPSTTTTNVRKRKRKKTHFIRTGCKASMRVKLNGEGVYEVMHHVTKHNHELRSIAWQHLQHSERSTTKEVGKAIQVMDEAGLKPSDSYRCWPQDAGGEENGGCMMGDHINHANMLRMEAIEGGDAQTLMDLLHQCSSAKTNFIFRVKLDDMGRLSGVFWRDSMMKEDYEIYGDVTVFDTRHRTNQYNLICASFYGVNNHRQYVMFGCAFLADEKIESFAWLLEVFKEAMGGKCPETFFTDQDHAIDDTIKKVFPQSRHRLCLWHIQQNAITHSGELRRDNSFKEAFTQCLMGCDNEREFDTKWNSMITNYGLQDNPWFTLLYHSRDKWCPALSKDFFSAGVLLSQRSESTNYAIGFRANKTATLTQFFSIFKATIDRWRRTEECQEFECSRSAPKFAFSTCGLLQHAAEVYTLTVFRDFEKEFITAIGTIATKLSDGGDFTMFEVCLEGEIASTGQVAFRHVNNSILVSCSCKHFEEVGWLCFHCIRVLHLHSISRIPQQYIAKRWTKMAKAAVWDKVHGQSDRSNHLKDSIPWRHDMARKYYNLVLKCQDNEQARRLLEDSYNRDSLAIAAISSCLANPTEQSGTNSGVASATTSAPAVLDPPYSFSKERSNTSECHF